MEIQTLPKLLDLPNKLLPLIEQFDNYRIFLIDGGRYGTKSHSVARFLLYLNDKYNLRTVCAREIQTTIKDSVHQLLSDLINQFQLSFETQKTSIKSTNKNSEFLFIGLREQDRFNVKSFEGADILWIEEGQTVSKNTIDVVLPTIRKKNSKIIVTMNRHIHNDPAYSMLVNRPDCLHINVNYTDLEDRFVSNEIKNEIDICKNRSIKDYEHIYLGKPLDQSEDSLYSVADFEYGKQMAHILAPGYGVRVGGFDIARFGDDKCAAVILQQMGALHWEEIFCDEWDHRDLNYTTGKILMISNEYQLDMAAIDEDGLGGGPLDSLRKGRGLDQFVGFRNPQIGYNENKSYGNVRTKNAYKFKDAIVKGHRHIKTQKIIDEMLTIKYQFDHNQRRILVSKDKMKKDGFKSPNLADAVIMAESLIGQVKEKQERIYSPSTHNSYSKEENLFGIAGVR